jgi:hypothetical protein
MKLQILKAIAVALALATTARAVPLPIVGDLSFTGTYTVDNSNLALATQFTSFSGVVVVDPSGDYAGTDGAAVTFTAPLVFAPPTPPGLMWTFNHGGKTFSLDALTLTVPFKTSNILVLEGEGIAKITGHADTPGYWNLTANRAGASFSFSSSAVIPEPTGFLLTASGLVVVGWLGRRARRS